MEDFCGRVPGDVLAGVFLLVTKLTGKADLGLAASAAVGLLNCFKVAASADETGIEKPGIVHRIRVVGCNGAILAWFYRILGRL